MNAELTELARRVACRELDPDDAQPLVAEICTRYGPAAVRTLDAFYESEIARHGNGLLWRCTKCSSVEPVQTDGAYVEGDSEPCIYCEDGVSKVERPVPTEER